ncbi:MAG: hypothetical protein MJA32_13345 [Proteobacteria bacterium]|nr:hypothetical protein [Pseudomonadota bacterium]
MTTRDLYLSAAIAASLSLPALADEHDEDEIPWAVAEVFFELNDTDGDLGIHALVDGEPWKRMRIFDVNERRMLGVRARGRLRRQGVTEIFFESAEPTFDELPPHVFFRRFPEGSYEIEGITLEGDELESETEITHAMPAPAEPTVNGIPAAQQCDDEEPGYDAPVIVADEYVIAWQPVTTTHPTLGSPQGAPGLGIVNYQVVVETELETPGGEFTTIFSVILPPDVTEMTIPEEFLDQADEFKYEVLARETSWNQTAIESCFLTGEE